MSTVEIRTQDERLAPAAEFETVEAWLNALPPYTIMLMTLGEGDWRTTIPCSVEDIIDGLALAPLIQQRLRPLLADLGWDG